MQNNNSGFQEIFRDHILQLVNIEGEKRKKLKKCYPIHKGNNKLLKEITSM